MAPTSVSPRHQMPSTSSGQNVAAAMAKARPTTVATADIPRDEREHERYDDGHDRRDTEGGDPLEPLAHHVLGDHAGHRDGQARGGGQERGEGPGGQQRREQVAAEAADHARGQLEHDAVGASRCRRGRVRRGGRGRRTPAAARRRARAARAPRPSSAAPPGRRGWCRSAPRRGAGPWCRGRSRPSASTSCRAGGRPRSRPGWPTPTGLAAQRGSAGELPPSPSQTTTRKTSGTSRAVSLSQYWKACTKVIERIPPDSTLRSTTTATTSPPAQGGRPVAAAQGQPGALELRHHVEPADRDHHHRGERAHGARVRAGPRRSRGACRRPTGAAVRRPAPAARGSRRSSRPGTRASRRRRLSTSPAMPRKEAAERYSPLIAEAFSPGRTEREATKKSEVVRLNRSPQRADRQRGDA